MGQGQGAGRDAGVVRDRLIANEPLGVGALSYVEAITIGVVADRDVYPDLDMFVAGARQTLETLGVSVHAIPTPNEVTP